MECHHGFSEAEDPSSADFYTLNAISKCNDHSTEMVSQAPRFASCHSITSGNNGALSQNNPTVNPQSLANLSGSDESFEFINDTDVISAVETKCHNPQNSTTKSLHDTEESNYSWTANASTSNVNFLYANNSTDDESYEWVDEALVSVIEYQNLPNPQDISPNFTSKLESHPDTLKDERFACSANVSMPKMNSSSDSDDSFEFINKSPEKVFDLKETQQLYLPQNVSSDSTLLMFTNEEIDTLGPLDIFARPKIPEASCLQALPSAHLSFDTEFNFDNTEKERQVSPTNVLTDVDKSFKKLYDELESMLSVNKTAFCHKPLPSAHLSFGIECNRGNAEEERAVSTTTYGNKSVQISENKVLVPKSMCQMTLMPSHLNFCTKSNTQLTPNLAVPTPKVSTDEDEAVKKLDNMVSVVEATCYDIDKSAYSSFDMASNIENLKENAAFHYCNPLPEISSSNSEESLDSPISAEDTVPMTEIAHLEGQMSACLISNIGSVDDMEENGHLLSPDVFTHLNSSVDCPKYVDKLSEEFSGYSPSSIIVYENKISSDMASLNLNSDLKSIDGTAEENTSSPSKVSISGEIPDDYDKTLMSATSTISPPQTVERKVESSIEGASVGNMMKVISENLKNCFIETQLDEYISPNKRVAKEEKDFMNVLNDKHVPKQKDNRCCVEHNSRVYEVISGQEKAEDKVREEIPFRPVFFRPEIPDDVFVLRSGCLDYLNNLKLSSSRYFDHCKEKENGIRWKTKDLFARRKPFKRKLMEVDWEVEMKDIESYPGFCIDF